MTKHRILTAITLTCLAGLSFLPGVNAQCDLSGSPLTELRTPLVEGALMSLPNQAPMPGMPEIPGAGPTPAPVTPGMMGNPSLLPSNLTQPANIGGSSYYLPFDPATTSIPGQLGPSLYVPPPASTPGTDPGMIHAPLDFIPPPVLVTNINPGGGLSGAAPINRWGGQTTRDFGLYRYGGTQKYDFGQGMVYGQASQDGPFQQLPGAVPTQDLYGARGYARGGATTQTIAPY